MPRKTRATEATFTPSNAIRAPKSPAGEHKLNHHRKHSMNKYAQHDTQFSKVCARRYTPNSPVVVAKTPSPVGKGRINNGKLTLTPNATLASQRHARALAHIRDKLIGFVRFPATKTTRAWRATARGVVQHDAWRVYYWQARGPEEGTMIYSQRRARFLASDFQVNYTKAAPQLDISTPNNSLCLCAIICASARFDCYHIT